MPVAQPFKALGRGNGFPFCVSRAINVLDRGDGQPFAYWTTLGGFNKDSGGIPSQEQIALSLRNAMKLFWNLYALDGIARGYVAADDEADDEGADEGDVSFEVNQVGFEEYTFSTFPSSIMNADGEPRERACLSSSRQLRNVDVLPGGSSALGIDFFCYRMYLGSTANEDNFIGYGFDGLWGAATTSYTISDVDLRSAISYPRPPVSSKVVEYAYTTISGIPFVCEAEAFYRDWDDDDTGSKMVNAAARIATASHENSEKGIPKNDSEVRLDSLDFYTY